MNKANRLKRNHGLNNTKPLNSRNRIEAADKNNLMRLSHDLNHQAFNVNHQTFEKVGHSNKAMSGTNLS